MQHWKVLSGWMVLPALSAKAHRFYKAVEFLRPAALDAMMHDSKFLEHPAHRSVHEWLKGGDTAAFMAALADPTNSYVTPGDVSKSVFVTVRIVFACPSMPWSEVTFDMQFSSTCLSGLIFLYQIFVQSDAQNNDKPWIIHEI